MSYDPAKVEYTPKPTSPIKVGVLHDMVFPPPGRYDVRADTRDALKLAFKQHQDNGLLDRPVEMAERTVDALPRGTTKALVDAMREMVDEGCLLIIGPLISENAYAAKEYLEAEGHVPAISWCGTDAWLGEWTFAIGNGSLPDEPFQLANIIGQSGARRLAVIFERYGRGFDQLTFVRDAAEFEGLDLVAEIGVDPRTSVAEVVDAIEAAGAEAVICLSRILVGRTAHIALGLRAAINARGLRVPTYLTSAFTMAYLDDATWTKLLGWIGMDQYDEANKVGQAFLDDFHQEYGRRPPYMYPLYGRDMGTVAARALARAWPLTPSGVRDSLELVKNVPAACGAPGTLISFGPWTRRGWMGLGYMTARELNTDLTTTTFRGRYTPRDPARSLYEDVTRGV